MRGTRVSVQSRTESASNWGCQTSQGSDSRRSAPPDPALMTKAPPSPAHLCAGLQKNDQDVAHQVIMATSDCVPQTTNCCSRPRHQLAELWANAPPSESVVHEVRQEQHCHRFCTRVTSPRRPARRHGQQFSTEKGHRQSRQAAQQFRETCGMHGKRKRHSPNHRGNLNLWCLTQRTVARSAPQTVPEQIPCTCEKRGGGGLGCPRSAALSGFCTRVKLSAPSSPKVRPAILHGTLASTSEGTRSKKNLG